MRFSTSLPAIPLVGLLAALAGAATPAPAQMAPPTWGNPDQPWGTRRPVTAADQARIASYRSGHRAPAFQTDFTDAAALQLQWALQSDDHPDLQACRQPQSVIATPAGLELKTLAAVGKCHARWSTGFLISRSSYSYGFFEARFRAADISGLNNAFWLVSASHFEIDVAEVHEPNDLGMSLHDWTTSSGTSVGFDSKLKGDFSRGFHDFGVLWTPTDIVYEVDGRAIAAIATHGAIDKPVDIRFSTALAPFAGKVPADPAGHAMSVRSLRVYPL
ncbi:glycoside hydrolase family 16 protein [Labrys wisconsinensis]|uniref:GH16 domain-containing protein n=1 Tax=Labrys wisconsinensis TaxID=425677 RepID=A0ABU0JEI4_9HYPH|nr:glycoside hydrolase family 16 protein [Labrys wisconsinensis]MDQ0472692.1 hypothetical protein [Labrys wisconsinensis]